jgi:AmiR/NasT family two-component response regulator
MNRRVLVAMREHSLRRIIAGSLRTAGYAVVEAFEEPDMRWEIESTERPFDAVIRDARRSPEATLDEVVRMRDAEIDVPAVFVVSRMSAGFVSEARRLGVTLLPLPLKSSALFVALDTLPHPSRASAQRLVG